MTRAAALLSILVLAGCGTGGLGEVDTAGADGEAMFKEKCAGCHELAAAGAPRGIGPSLDDAFAAARKEKFDESTIREVVLGQMRFPIPPMPEPDSPQMFGDLSEQKREQAMAAIASYVASVAANPTAIAQAQQQGGGGSATGNDPKALFQANCASCHTFAAAGATGTIGPNLDQLQVPVPRIEQQIRNGGAVMPAFKDKLTDAQIKALAKWVAANRKG
ncbi:MAG TPA: c-type cytochrome [Gaiellaceae bacterium]|nr:c-type cytochrome [Gaiellaceae bacterium]